MAGKATGTFVIKFGDVPVTVRMYSATDEHNVAFHEYHKDCVARLGRKKVCLRCGNEVVNGDVVKGFTTQEEVLGENGNVLIPGKVVTFTSEELKALKPQGKGMEVKFFVHPSQVPVAALDKPYYIGSDVPSEKKTKTTMKGATGQAFQFFKKSLEASKKWAYVEWTARENKYAGVLIPYERGIVLKRLLWNDELRPFDIPVLDANIPQTLIDVGVKVIAQNTKDFNHTDVVDPTPDMIREIIAKRDAGEVVVVAKEAEEKVEDLGLSELEKLAKQSLKE